MEPEETLDGAQTTQAEATVGSARSGLGKRMAKWAIKYDRCVRCGRDDIKHMAHGLCVICYEKESNVRNKGYRPRGQGLRDELTKDYLRQEYVRKKRSTIDIAKDLGCTRQTVSKALRKFGLSSRSLADASDLAFRGGKKRVRRVDESGQESTVVLDKVDVNETFFASWSAQMAYVLGLIYTDGCVLPGYKIDPRRSSRRPTSSFSLAQKEPELLQKVLALMDCNAKLRYRKEKRYGSVVAGALYSFEISSENIYHDLLALGVTPHKSLTLSFPEMPPEFARHFIRGCWDGDGTVFVPWDGNTAQARASIVTGSLEFITGLVDHLYHVGISRRRGGRSDPVRIHVQRKAYRVEIKGEENLAVLFHHLYDDVDSSIRLERKYLKFLEIMRLYDELSRWRNAGCPVE